MSAGNKCSGTKETSKELSRSSIVCDSLIVQSQGQETSLEMCVLRAFDEHQDNDQVQNMQRKILATQEITYPPLLPQARARLQCWGPCIWIRHKRDELCNLARPTSPKQDNTYNKHYTYKLNELPSRLVILVTTPTFLMRSCTRTEMNAPIRTLSSQCIRKTRDHPSKKIRLQSVPVNLHFGIYTDSLNIRAFQVA